MRVISPFLGETESPSLFWVFHLMESGCGDEKLVCLGREEQRKRILFFWSSRTKRRHPFSRAAEEKGKLFAKAEERIFLIFSNFFHPKNTPPFFSRHFQNSTGIFETDAIGTPRWSGSAGGPFLKRFKKIVG